MVSLRGIDLAEVLRGGELVMMGVSSEAAVMLLRWSSRLSGW